MPTTSEGRPTSPRRKPLPGWAVFVIVLVLGVWVARRVALLVAVSASVKVAKELSESLPEARNRGVRPEDDLLFPLWPLGPGVKVGAPVAETVGEPAPSKATVQVKKREAMPRIGPPPQSTRASVKQVLRWAEHQIAPRGVARPAGGGMPAGIELYDVESLGLGLHPGDRLVTVDGIPVVERAQVVGAVLGARSRRAESMTAGLVRRTKDGPVRFTVVVEQPYPEDVPDAAEVVDSSP